MRSDVNGIIVVDKPEGMTSAKVVAEVKKISGAARVGHTGTLDPFATGVLICCLNQATRLARFFLHGRKRYEGLLRLGSTTDTQDATGRILETSPVPKLDRTAVERMFRRFEGRIWQRPPAYAALKHEGTPLYKLARQGKPVQKPARPVTITSLRVMQVELPDVRFDVACSAGTYVRTLCDDIGREVGCGAHLAELRRTESCGFSLPQSVSLGTLGEMAQTGNLEKVVISMAESLKEMPEFRADGNMVTHIGHGRPLTPEPFTGGDPDRIPEAFLKIVDRSNRLIAVIEWSPENETYVYCCVFK